MVSRQYPALVLARGHLVPPNSNRVAHLTAKLITPGSCRWFEESWILQTALRADGSARGSAAALYSNETAGSEAVDVSLSYPLGLLPGRFHTLITRFSQKFCDGSAALADVMGTPPPLRAY